LLVRRAPMVLAERPRAKAAARADPTPAGDWVARLRDPN